MEGIAHTRDQARRTTGECGNNPTHQSEGNMGGGSYSHEGQKQHHGVTGKLHRSGSSSSSSSEDDGMGGRRKKGIKDKIKEKLPGGNKSSTTTTGAACGYEGEQGNEKKGMVDKIKDVLPGSNRD